MVGSQQGQGILLIEEWGGGLGSRTNIISTALQTVVWGSHSMGPRVFVVDRSVNEDARVTCALCRGCVINTRCANRMAG